MIYLSCRDQSVNSKSMKSSITAILAFLSISLFGQDFQYQESFDTISLVERNVYLSSITRSALYEGSSTNAISFTLPDNTTEWYYAFATTEGEKGEGFLNLASSLYASTVVGGTSSISEISIPQGVNAINISLMSSFAAQNFSSGREYNYFPNSSVQNSNQGAIQVKDNLEGNFALGLSNPSQLNGVHVFVEVIAVVSNKTLLNQGAIEDAAIFARFAASKFISRDYEQALALCDSSISKYELGYAYGVRSAAQLQQQKEIAAIKSLKQALVLLSNQSENNTELNSLKSLFKQLKKKEKISEAQEFIDIINEQRWNNILEE